jgi:hypothetical protein
MDADGIWDRKMSKMAKNIPIPNTYALHHRARKFIFGTILEEKNVIFRL